MPGIISCAVSRKASCHKSAECRLQKPCISPFLSGQDSKLFLLDASLVLAPSAPPVSVGPFARCLLSLRLLPLRSSLNYTDYSHLGRRRATYNIKIPKGAKDSKNCRIIQLKELKALKELKELKKAGRAEGAQ
eukprot:scaffold2602_cov246-Pinguiococcus_pyrenoidosus.AAC.6